MIAAPGESHEQMALSFGSHYGEVIGHSEIEVLALHDQRQVVVDAVVAHLEQEVAGLAATERALDPLVMTVDKVLDRLAIDFGEAELGREDLDHLAELALRWIGGVDLVRY